MIIDVSKIVGMTVEEASKYLNQLFKEKEVPFIAYRQPITNVDVQWDENGKNKLIVTATIKRPTNP
jgi:hypothetical protein